MLNYKTRCLIMKYKFQVYIFIFEKYAHQNNQYIKMKYCQRCYKGLFIFNFILYNIKLLFTRLRFVNPRDLNKKKNLNKLGYCALVK